MKVGFFCYLWVKLEFFASESVRKALCSIRIQCFLDDILLWGKWLNQWVTSVKSVFQPYTLLWKGQYQTAPAFWALLHWIESQDTRIWGGKTLRFSSLPDSKRLRVGTRGISWKADLWRTHLLIWKEGAAKQPWPWGVKQGSTTWGKATMMPVPTKTNLEA